MRNANMLTLSLKYRQQTSTIIETVSTMMNVNNLHMYLNQGYFKTMSVL